MSLGDRVLKKRPRIPGPSLRGQAVDTGRGFPLDLRAVAWYKLPVSTSTDRPGLADGHIFCARIPADLPPRFIQ